MSLLVVIVNYRTAELTLQCLHSLAAERCRGESFTVSLIEGGSNDDSAAVLAGAIAANGWDDWVSLKVADRNGGFAYANNLAIAPVIESGDAIDAIWLLNPDTYLRPGAIAPLRQALFAADDVGIVGSRLEDPDGRPQCSAFRFPSISSELEDAMRLGMVSRLLSSRMVAPPVSDAAMQTDWVSGASMMVRTQVFRDIGLLDASFFMYFEETDFCRRAGLAGWQTRIEPHSRVVHLVGQASGITGKRRAIQRRPDYWFESRRRYFLRYHGGVQTALADSLWLTGRAFWYLMQALRRRPRLGEPPGMWADFLRNSVLARGFVMPGSDSRGTTWSRASTSQSSVNPSPRFEQG